MPKTWNTITNYIFSNEWVKYGLKKGNETWEGVNKWFDGERAKFKEKEESSLRGSIYTEVLRAGNYAKYFLEQKIFGK
jgi:hypothetical protein